MESREEAQKFLDAIPGVTNENGIYYCTSSKSKHVVTLVEEQKFNIKAPTFNRSLNYQNRSFNNNGNNGNHNNSYHQPRRPIAARRKSTW